MKLLRVGLVLCGVAALFCCLYAHAHNAAAGVMLLTFWIFFINLFKSSAANVAPGVSAITVSAVASPIRELAKGLGCLVGGAAIAAIAGVSMGNNKLTVAIMLTAVVVGFVAFVLFLIRACTAWGSRRGGLD